MSVKDTRVGLAGHGVVVNISLELCQETEESESYQVSVFTWTGEQRRLGPEEIEPVKSLSLCLHGKGRFLSRTRRPMSCLRKQTAKGRTRYIRCQTKMPGPYSRQQLLSTKPNTGPLRAGAWAALQVLHPYPGGRHSQSKRCKLMQRTEKRRGPIPRPAKASPPCWPHIWNKMQPGAGSPSRLAPPPHWPRWGKRGAEPSALSGGGGGGAAPRPCGPRPATPRRSRGCCASGGAAGDPALWHPKAGPRGSLPSRPSFSLIFLIFLSRSFLPPPNRGGGGGGGRNVWNTRAESTARRAAAGPAAAGLLWARLPLCARGGLGAPALATHPRPQSPAVVGGRLSLDRGSRSSARRDPGEESRWALSPGNVPAAGRML